MSKISDERLESLLECYFKAEPEHIPDFTPSAPSKKGTSRNIRAVAAAASLLLAVALGVTVFALFNRPSTASDPAVTAETAPRSDETAEAFLPAVQPSYANGQHESEPTLPPAEAPSAPSSTLPYAPEAGGDGSAGSSENVPLSSAGSRAETQSAVPTAAPTVRPTAKTAEEPTSPATEISPTEAFEYPTFIVSTEDREIAQTAQWVNYLAHQSISGIVQKNMLTGEGRVYFRLYAFDGSPLGDSDLFSPNNLAAVTDNLYGTATASYYLGNLEDDLERIREGDMLTYSFFNEDGDVLCTRIMIF